MKKEEFVVIGNDIPVQYNIECFTHSLTHSLLILADYLNSTRIFYNLPKYDFHYPNLEKIQMDQFAYRCVHEKDGQQKAGQNNKFRVDSFV